MAGISDKAIKTQFATNKYRYNGKELQSQEFSDGTGLETYDFGARFYDNQLGRFTTVDPNANHTSDISPYVYCDDHPLNAVDPDGRDAILIAYPDYKISAFGTKWSNLGHAGVLLIDNKTGATKYYEYGRYDKPQKGVVRTRKVSNVVIGKDGKPTLESLTKVLNELSNLAGEGGAIRGAYVKSAKFKDMKKYADKKLAENKDDNRKDYGLFSNNCGTFAEDVILQDQSVVDPDAWTPRPNGIVSDWIDQCNAEVDYDPKSGKAKIGAGDESKAKKESSQNNKKDTQTSQIFFQNVRQEQRDARNSILYNDQQ